MTDPCTRSPGGWTCSRPEGHDGPCAATIGTLTQDGALIKTIVGCARCYGDGHTDLFFRELTHPVQIGDGLGSLTHWAPCPTNGEPILLRIVPEDTPPLEHERIAS